MRLWLGVEKHVYDRGSLPVFIWPQSRILEWQVLEGNEDQVSFNKLIIQLIYVSNLGHCSFRAFEVFLDDIVVIVLNHHITATNHYARFLSLSVFQGGLPTALISCCHRP